MPPSNRRTAESDPLREVDLSLDPVEGARQRAHAEDEDEAEGWFDHAMSRGPEMSFGDHLEELRRRILRALIGVGVASIVTFYFGRDIVAWLVRPLNRAQHAAGLPPETVGSLADPFLVYLKVSLIAGLILATPWVVYQLWRFIAEGLYPHERRVVHLLTPFSTVMTALAVAFTYYVLLPACLAFLVLFATSYPEAAPRGGAVFSDFITWAVEISTFGPTSDDRPPPPTPDAPASPPAPDDIPPARVPLLPGNPEQPVEGQVWFNSLEHALYVHADGVTYRVPMGVGTMLRSLIQLPDYITFVTFMGLGVVFAFQLPVVMTILSWSGLLPPSAVARYRRQAVLVCFIAGAVLTPQDPISMIVLGAVLLLLYELGLLSMRMVWKPRRSLFA